MPTCQAEKPLKGQVYMDQLPLYIPCMQIEFICLNLFFDCPVGRYDIARALEKWGGIREVSRLLSLKVRCPSRQANFGGREKKNDAATSSEQEKTPRHGRSSVLHDSQKWLMKLKQLEVNWAD